MYISAAAAESVREPAAPQVQHAYLSKYVCTPMCIHFIVCLCMLMMRNRSCLVAHHGSIVENLKIPRAIITCTSFMPWTCHAAYDVAKACEPIIYCCCSWLMCLQALEPDLSVCCCWCASTASNKVRVDYYVKQHDIDRLKHDKKWLPSGLLHTTGRHTSSSTCSRCTVRCESPVPWVQ